MSRYLILNGCVLIVLFMFVWLKQRTLITKRWLTALSILLLMTLIFDSLIIGLDIVAYNPKYYLEIHLLKAPLEDFAYTIAALLVVPYIWKVLGRKNDKSH